MLEELNSAATRRPRSRGLSPGKLDRRVVLHAGNLYDSAAVLRRLRSRTRGLVSDGPQLRGAIPVTEPDGHAVFVESLGEIDHLKERVSIWFRNRYRAA